MKEIHKDIFVDYMARHERFKKLSVDHHERHQMIDTLKFFYADAQKVFDASVTAADTEPYEIDNVQNKIFTAYPMMRYAMATGYNKFDDTVIAKDLVEYISSI